MANCIIADEKKRKEDSKIKELTEAENTIKEIYEKLKSAVNKYNRLSDSKTYVCTLTSSGQPSKSDFNAQSTSKCSCNKKCKNKDSVGSLTLNIDEDVINELSEKIMNSNDFHIDENVIKELSERIASGDIFKLFSGI